METILDHNPTPFELHQLGYTDDPATPLTDELRAEIISVVGGDPLAIYCLLGMRGDDTGAMRSLHAL